MQRKLNVRGGPADVKTDWMDNYFDTSDLNGRSGEEVKIGLTTYADGSITDLVRKYLSLINPEEGRRLINGAVDLSIDDRYGQLKGEGVIITQRDKLAPVLNEWITKKQAKDSLFWVVMLRHPNEVPQAFAIQGLHDEAIDYIFSEYQARFAKKIPLEDVRAMGVFPGSASNLPIMGAWCVDGLGGRSDAYGGGGLGSDYGRVVGIAPGGV